MKRRVIILSSATKGGAGRLSKLLSQLIPNRELEVLFTPQSKHGLKKPSNLGETVRLIPVMALAAFDKWIIKKSNWKSEFSMARTLWSEKRIRAQNSSDLALVRYGAGYVSNEKLIEAGFSKVFVGLPDELALTGGCHYSLKCNQYLDGCYSCPAVRTMFRGLVARNFRRKVKSSLRIKNRLTYIYPSQGMKDKFARSPIGLLSHASAVIGHPVAEDFIRGPQRARAREKSNKVNVVSVAENLDDPVKGIDDVIRLAKTSKINASFTLVGKASRRLRNMCTGSTVKFTGTLEASELVDAVSGADLFLVSSHGEFFGSAALQALAAGVPVLARAETGAAAMCKDLGVEFVFEDYEHLERILVDGVHSRIKDIAAVIGAFDWEKRNSDSVEKYRRLFQNRF